MNPIPPPFRPFRPAIPARSARESVLAQWRGIDWGPVEKAHQLAARAAASLVPTVVQQLGLDRRRSEAEVIKAWNSLIDPTVTAHAQPTGLRRGTLFVAVDSSVWLEEIMRYRRREILQRLQYTFGPELVKRLSFRAAG